MDEQPEQTMGQGKIGAGTSVFHGPLGASPTFVEVPDVQDVGFPEISATDVKDTNYKTPGTQHDYVPGWAEGGDVEVKKDFVAAAETTLRGLFRTRLTWKVQLVTGENWTFEGYIKKLAGSLPSEEKISTNFTIKVCTPPVFSPT